MEALPEIPAVGTRVEFAIGTPQYPHNAGIVYIVQSPPRSDGDGYSRDEHGRPYVWLVTEETAALAPSRQRRRTGYVASLVAVS